MVSAEGQKITARFFEAVDALISMGRLRGLQTLSKEIGVEGGNMRKLKRQPDTYILKPEYIRHIVIEYGVSANWVITGSGKMLNQQ